jgi:hypothetical protein
MKAPDFIFRLDRHRRFLSGQASPSTRSCGEIVLRVIALIDLCRTGISHLQRLPVSITRAAILEAKSQRRYSPSFIEIGIGG